MLSLAMLFMHLTGNPEVLIGNESCFEFQVSGMVAQMQQEERICRVGDDYQPLEAYDINGKQHTIQIDSLNYILLNFTTTGCAACRASVDELKKINESFEDSLRIISFYHSRGKEFWKYNINQMNIPWLCLTDAYGGSSNNLRKYGISNFPVFILISPDGKVLERYEGYKHGLVSEMLNTYTNIQK